MSSVTQRIREIKQPYGGYIRPRDFEKEILEDGVLLFPEENIQASLVGTAVDYLTRYSMGTPVVEAFKIPVIGATLVGETQYAQTLLSSISGLDDESIGCACKLAGYDVCVRAGCAQYKSVDTITPDEYTVFNIRTMVKRSIAFWEKYGPIIVDGFTFEGGYTNVITSGDGDYLTKDTLWDFKVSKNNPKTNHTLQLLIYYIMGCHSIHNEFSTIRKLGIYNPRLNTVYTFNVDKIAKEVIDAVSVDVIGYIDEHTAVIPTENQTDKSFRKTPVEEWSLNDLINRYGVSRAKITGDFFRLGLPYHKVGRAYRFDPDEIVEWEIEQRAVPYGKNGRIILPGYELYGEYLKAELRVAKHNRDKERISLIKQELKYHGFTSDIGIIVLFSVAFIALMFLVCYFLF